MTVEVSERYGMPKRGVSTASGGQQQAGRSECGRVKREEERRGSYEAEASVVRSVLLITEWMEEG